MARPDDSPATWGDVKRIYRKLDARIDECFDAVSALDNKQSEFWDEHEDKLGRLNRALTRLKRDVDQLGEE